MKNLQLSELQNPAFSKIQINKMSDKALLALCQKYGTQAILWKRKFIGLLPEVDRRELYLKKRCSSIYEFAAKFGGITKKHTQRVIQIDKAFEEKGVTILREMLQEGVVSINKLAKIVSVIGMTEEKELVAAIKKLSCRTLETYVVDLRRAFGNRENTGGVRIENGLFEPLFEGKSVHVNTFADVVVMGDGQVEVVNKTAVDGGLKIEREDFRQAGADEIGMQSQKVALKKIKLNLSDTARAKGLRGEIRSEATMEVFEEMLELQGKGIDIDALLKEFLRKRKENMAEKKEETVRKVIGREEERRSEGKKPIRQISVETKRILQEEYGTKCAVNGCNKAAEHLHHTVPFSINGSNSPDLLKPLCRAHHDIVHSVNAVYVEKKGMG